MMDNQTIRPIMEDGSPITWSERVRIERPDAPEWLVVWARIMDSLDKIEASLDKLEAHNKELINQIRRNS